MGEEKDRKERVRKCRKKEIERWILRKKDD